MRHGLILLLLLLSAFESTIAQNPWLDATGKTKPVISSTHKSSSYDDLPDLVYHFLWHDSLVAWDSVFMETLTYSVNGDLTERLWQQYTGNGFSPQQRTIFTYISPGLQSTGTGFTWNGNSWEEEYRTEMTYDLQGNTTLFLNYFWTGQNWDTAFGQRSTYDYAFTNRIAAYTEEFWDSSTHAWENTWREEFNFPTAMAWDTATYYLWTGNSWQPDERFVDVNWFKFEKGLAYTARNQAYGGSGWDDVARFRCTFGANDSPTYVWDEWSGSDWDSTTKEVIRYDIHENQTLDETFEWIGAWQQTAGLLSHFSYDGLGRTTEVIDELFDGYIYRYAGRRTYPTFFTGEDEGMDLDFQVAVYPNPCTDRFTIGFENAPNGPVDIRIYDLNGQLRVHTQLNSIVGNSIHVPISETLASGSYIYRIATKSGATTGKILVQR